MNVQISIWGKRIIRWLKWFMEEYRYCSRKSETTLRYQIVKHQLPLSNNKIENIRRVSARINSILIRPRETFSFWKLVGIGIGQANGEGICELANLLYWMALHTPMEIVEYHQNKTDFFAESVGDVPWGFSINVFYNYYDLKFTNNTPYTFQINLWFDEKNLLGEILSDEQLSCTYLVFEKWNEVVERGGKVYRRNEIWRSIYHRLTGDKISESLVMKNFGETKYNPNIYK